MSLHTLNLNLSDPVSNWLKWRADRNGQSLAEAMAEVLAEAFEMDMTHTMGKPLREEVDLPPEVPPDPVNPPAYSAMMTADGIADLFGGPLAALHHLRENDPRTRSITAEDLAGLAALAVLEQARTWP